MALCSICNNLQVDATTNESPDDTNWPGPDRLRTFSLSEPMKAWRKSAEQGCATCRLIWDGLLHFYEKSVSELEEVLLEDDEPVHINLGGILGETLLLELHPLSKGMRFPGLEFYTSRSRYIN